MFEKKNVVTTIIVTIAVSLIFQIFNNELIGIADLIRHNPFETMVLLCLGVILVVTVSTKHQQQ